MKKFLIIAAIVAAAAGFGIYKLVGTVSKGGEKGDAAVAVFHKGYNANDIAKLHTAAAPDFRSSVSLEKFTSFTGMLHEKLGEWKSGERTGVNVKNDNGNKTLEMSWQSTFTHASGTEEFVFDYNGDEPLLLHYDVKSAALLNDGAGEAQPKKSKKPESAEKPDNEESKENP